MSQGLSLCHICRTEETYYLLRFRSSQLTVHISFLPEVQIAGIHIYPFRPTELCTPPQTQTWGAVLALWLCPIGRHLWEESLAQNSQRP